MNQRLRVAMAITMTSAAWTVSAEQTVGDFYVVPQGGYVWLDNDRNAGDSGLLGLSIGKHFNEAVSVEVGFTRGDYNLGPAQDLELTTYTLDALHIFARESAVSPYITAGIGVQRNKPDNVDRRHDRIAQAGVGMFMQVAEREDGSLKFALRPEVKARWALPPTNNPQDKYLDYVAMLGFQFAFGSPRPAPEPVAAPEPAPAPEPEPAPAPAPEPPPDSDGDGVIDTADRCPGTPRGVAVDADGCPRKGTATLQGVTFEFNSARLTSDSRPVLDEVAADLKRYPRLRVELQGHTDSVGADAYNLRLSQERADSVREYLVSQGVAAGQLTSRGYGESQPIRDNASEEGRAFNRRVVMSVIDNPGEVDVQVEPPQQP